MRTQEQTNRFKDADWLPKNKEAVLVGGAGGIGSWVTFFLTKIGFNAYLYDFDTVETHNLGGQLFKQDAVGKPKVEAVREVVEEYCGVQISTFQQMILKGRTNQVQEKIIETSPGHMYCVSAFDNMEARKTMFNTWKKFALLYPETAIFIDGRLELESFQIFCVTPDKIADYEKHLFSDSIIEEAACTLKQTSHTAAMIATTMTAFLTNHIANLNLDIKLREVPFFYEFVSPMAMTNIQM